MSLKGFHVLFIALSVGLALVMGVWGIGRYLSPGGTAGYVLTAIVSFLVAGMLGAYAVKFVRKARQIGLR